MAGDTLGFRLFLCRSHARLGRASTAACDDTDLLARNQRPKVEDGRIPKVKVPSEGRTIWFSESRKRPRVGRKSAGGAGAFGSRVVSSLPYTDRCRTGMLRWFQTLMLAMGRIQARQRLFIIVPYGFFPDLIRHGLDPRTFVPIILLPKARSTAELASGFLRHANRGPGLARGVASFLRTNKGCTMG